jgi:hypothetical protein
MLKSTKEENVMSTIKNPPEGGNTNIPMSSAELPQQRLYEVKSLPQRPAGLAVTFMDYESQHGLPGIPKKPTKKSISLAQVEWAWSPMNSRVDGYELHKGKAHWLLWCGGPDDNDCNHICHWYAVACMPLMDICDEDAAIYLLQAYWEAEAGNISLDRYHWINWAGALSVSQVQAIADSIWPLDDDEE